MLVPNSVWTLPLVIVGALMVLVAWIGSRLAGHVLVKWGETGARVDLHAEVISARHRQGQRQRRPVIAAVPEPLSRPSVTQDTQVVDDGVGAAQIRV